MEPVPPIAVVHIGFIKISLEKFPRIIVIGRTKGVGRVTPCRPTVDVSPHTHSGDLSTLLAAAPPGVDMGAKMSISL